MKLRCLVLLGLFLVSPVMAQNAPPQVLAQSQAA